MYNFIFILAVILFLIDGFLAISMLFMGQIALGAFIGFPFWCFCGVVIPVGKEFIKDYFSTKIKGMKKYQY